MEYIHVNINDTLFYITHVLRLWVLSLRIPMMSHNSQDCTTFAEAPTPCYSNSTISGFTAKPSIVNAPLLIFLEYGVLGENSVLLRNSFHPHHFSKGHIVF